MSLDTKRIRAHRSLKRERNRAELEDRSSTQEYRNGFPQLPRVKHLPPLPLVVSFFQLAPGFPLISWCPQMGGKVLKQEVGRSQSKVGESSLLFSVRRLRSWGEPRRSWKEGEISGAWTKGGVLLI